MSLRRSASVLVILSPSGGWRRLGSQALSRSDKEAVDWFRRAIGVDRNLPNAHFYLAAALAHLGRLDEAKASLTAGLAINPAYTISGFRAGSFSDNPTFLAQRERVYEGLRKAGVPEA